MAVDNAGGRYITDAYDNRVWKLAPGAINPTPWPFTDLGDPRGVAVDEAGSVYVTDFRASRVLKLAAGANNSTVVPFPRLESPDAVAVDDAGNLYVTDFHDPCAGSAGRCDYLDKTGRVGDGRVLKLAAGSTTANVLPFNGLARTWSVAVNAAEEVYAVDTIAGRVLKLPARAGSEQ